MTDCISREAAEKVLSQPVTMSMCLTLEECKQKNAQRQIDLFVIRCLPTADVRPVVRGTWVEDVVFYAEDGSPCFGLFCDQCETPFPSESNFCPNCGAMMEES